MQLAQEVQLYQALIDAVETQFRLANPSCVAPIREWRGKEIIDFQEELLQTVQGRISEKWFYTHIRQQQDKPPRIDILNMLSQYAGFGDWAGFSLSQHSQGVLLGEADKEVVAIAEMQSQASWSLKRKGARIGALAVGMLTLVFIATLLAFTQGHPDYSICFLDADTRSLPAQGGVEIVLWEDGESLRRIPADEKGCVHFSTHQQKVKFTVTAPYYLPQTIERVLDKEKAEETILLKADDYALMLHYFSESKVDDWKRRREQLDEMLHEDVKIVQVAPGSGLGVEMYNKQEFIDRMTLPVKSLRNLEILQTEYDKGKIVMMRFIVSE